MLTKIEDDLVKRMDFGQYMKFAKWIVSHKKEAIP